MSSATTSTTIAAQAAARSRAKSPNQHAIVTAWTADVNGHPVRFWVESDHHLAAQEMRERVEAARATEAQLRAPRARRADGLALAMAPVQS